MTRIRLVFEKRGPACFVRHVELPQLFGRIARRAGLKIQLTQGMSPHPRVVIGAALPVGVVSLYELAEIWFAETLAPSEILAKMNATTPGGFRFIKAAEIQPDAPSLGKSYDAAEWWLMPREKAKIKNAAESLRRNFSPQTLLTIQISQDEIKLSTRDPAQTGPNTFVKALIADGIITGWPQICIARLSLGNWNAESARIVPLV